MGSSSSVLAGLPLLLCFWVFVAVLGWLSCVGSLGGADFSRSSILFKALSSLSCNCSSGGEILVDTCGMACRPSRVKDILEEGGCTGGW